MIDFFAPPQRQAVRPALQEADELQISPEERQSFLSRLYENSLGGLSYVGDVLNKTFGGRAIRGLLGGRPDEMLSIIPFSDTLGLTDQANEIQGRSLLQDWGLLDEGDRGLGSTVAGIGLEIALDPSTYMGIGPLTQAGRQAARAGTATRGLAAGIRSGERGLIGFGLPFQSPADDLIFGARRPVGTIQEMGGVGQFGSLQDAAKTYGLAEAAPLQDVMSAASQYGISRLDIDNYLDPALSRQAPTPSLPTDPAVLMDAVPASSSQEMLYRVPDYKAQGSNANAVIKELIGDQFAGKWFSKGAEQAEGYHGLGKAQLEFRPDRLGPDDVVEERLKEVGLGSKTPMYMHPALTSIRIKGQEIPAEYNDLLKLVDDVNASRVQSGLEPITIKATSTAPVATSGAEALTAPLSKGTLQVAGQSRSFDTGFRRTAEQFSAPAADFVDAILAAPGSIGSKALDVLQTIMSPIEKITGGANPIRGMRAVGANLADRAVRTANALFNPDVAGAWTKVGQSLGRGYREGVERYAQQGNELAADLIVTATQLGAKSPEAERAIFQGIERAVELPVDQAEFAKKIEKSFNDEMAKLEREVLEDKVTPSVLDRRYKEIEAKREYAMQILNQQQAYRQANDPIKLWEKHFDPGEVAMLSEKADALGKLMQDINLAEQAKGLYAPTLDDHIRYLSRQRSSLPKGEGEGAFAYARRRAMERSGDFGPSDVKRLEVFKSIPGGTSQARELIGDPKLRAMDQTQLEEHLREVLTGTKNPMELSPAWEHAKELAKTIKESDPRWAEPGNDYFKLDLIDNLKRRNETYATKMSLADTIKAGIDKAARPITEIQAEGTSAIPITDVLQRAGISEPEKLGISKKALLNYGLAEDVAADLVKIGTAWNNPQALAPVIQAYDAMLNAFKTGVTAPFPGFHFRNFMSGLFNQWRDDALSTSSLNATQRFLRGDFLPAEAAGKLYPGMELSKATEAFKKELLSRDVSLLRQSRQTGEVLGDTERLTRYQVPLTTGEAKPMKQVAKDALSELLPDADATAAGYSRLQQYLDPTLTEGVRADSNINRLVATGRMVGNTTEDLLRTSHYLEKRLQGFSPKAAAESVKKYQLDYQEMTQFEKNVMKRLVPWYSFSRRNLPPILEDLATQPAKLAATARVMTGGRDPDQFTPQYIAEGASLPLGQPAPGVNRFVSSFGLPIEDEAIKTIGSLMRGDVRRGFQQVLGMGNPLFKAPFEQAFDTQLYSGRRLSDLEPSAVASLGGLLPERTAQIASQFVANTPFARGVSSIDRLLDERKGIVPTLINLGTGARISDVDVNRSQLAAERTMLQELLRPSREVRVREDIYVPADQMQNLDPYERLLMEMYRGVQRDQSAAARARQAAGQ